jgi:hypothetical protein
VYFWIWNFLTKQYTKAQAKERILYASDNETVLADPFEFTWLDLDYYDAKQRELESFGFQKIRDVEFLLETYVFPETRTFYRSFINTEQDIIAGISHLRMVKPKNTLERMIDIRIVTFVSEFSDGTFLNTNNNAKGVNPNMEINSVIMHTFESDTPLEELLEAHKKKMEANL